MKIELIELGNEKGLLAFGEHVQTPYWAIVKLSFTPLYLDLNQPEPNIKLENN